MDTVETMLDAAEAFVALVSEIPHDAWDLPALGVWDVRSLVGHTARAVTTVLDYLNDPAASAELRSAAEYLAAGFRADRSIHDAVAARGVEAGHELGDEPGEVIETMIERLRVALAATSDDVVIRTRFGAIRLGTICRRAPSSWWCIPPIWRSRSAVSRTCPVRPWRPPCT